MTYTIADLFRGASGSALGDKAAGIKLVIVATEVPTSLARDNR